ncbi:MAG: hypothetical protein LBH49_01470 [Puniceicoccales bacterium]|jgi:hypothetical protein|nr:hypothetical protein [Puniceicoccales bacterium]
MKRSRFIVLLTVLMFQVAGSSCMLFSYPSLASVRVNEDFDEDFYSESDEEDDDDSE